MQYKICKTRLDYSTPVPYVPKYLTIISNVSDSLTNPFFVDSETDQPNPEKPVSDERDASQKERIMAK